MLKTQGYQADPVSFQSNIQKAQQEKEALVKKSKN
jgi:flagellar basal body rod protein FlgB